jgi:hypothetical protein
MTYVARLKFSAASGVSCTHTNAGQAYGRDSEGPDPALGVALLLPLGATTHFEQGIDEQLSLAPKTSLRVDQRVPGSRSGTRQGLDVSVAMVAAGRI